MNAVQSELGAGGTTSPHEDRPLRVAFVGQGVYFRQCALERPVGGIEPHFIDFRAAAPPGPMLARVQALQPDIVLVFRPEIIPPGAFAAVQALTIGYLTEPLPRVGGVEHPDLKARLWWLQQVDPSNFDRIICFDPLIAETAEELLPIWQSLPLPVADGLFMDLHDRSQPARIVFIGRSTEHRESMLAPLKARHAVLHIAHGLSGEALIRTLRRGDIQLNLHNNPYPSFENRVALALAGAQLVISEPLSPDYDLVDGQDFLEIHSPEQLCSLVEHLNEDPGAFTEVQVRGRERAEEFRASRLYPPLLRAALADHELHGSIRSES